MDLMIILIITMTVSLLLVSAIIMPVAKGILLILIQIVGLFIMVYYLRKWIDKNKEGTYNKTKIMLIKLLMVIVILLHVVSIISIILQTIPLFLITVK